MLENNLNQEISNLRGARVLLVDDNPDLLKLIQLRLKPQKFEIKTANSGEEALHILDHWQPNLVITDLLMPGISGLELHAKIHKRDPLIPVMILTAHGTIPDAVEATQSGVTSYLSKPFEPDVLIDHIHKALLSSGFSPNSKDQTLVADDHWRHKIVTQSASMEALMHQIEQLAPTDALLAFSGPPGCGKDELALAAYRKSHRSRKKLFRVSCIALPNDLLEIELFGEVGSGTDQNPNVLGVLQKANGASLLISDHENAPVSLVSKVLMAISEKKAHPIDSPRAYKCDIRLMTTSLLGLKNRSAPKELLRELAILNHVGINVPSLAERREDIPLIVNHVVNNFKEKPQMQFSAKAMQRLVAGSYPGNVKQLINVTKQCLQLSPTPIISAALVESRMDDEQYQLKPMSNAMLEYERDYITEVLKLTNGNVSQAAKIARKNRTEFHRLLRKHKVEAKAFRN